jgi:dihydroneopterin aldolase
MTDSIKLNAIRCFAPHGCLDEEAIVGAEYQLDLELFGSFERSFSSDDLNDTIDYVKVYSLAREELKKRSQLIEHVAERVAASLLRSIPMIESVSVHLAKENPPIPGDLKSVSVHIHRGRPA